MQVTKRGDFFAWSGHSDSKISVEEGGLAVLLLSLSATCSFLSFSNAPGTPLFFFFNLTCKPSRRLYTHLGFVLPVLLEVFLID